MASQTVSTSTRPATTGSVLRAGLIALVLSLVVNHLIRILAVALLNPDPAFLGLTTWTPVTLFTVIGVVGAVMTYALVRRFVANADRVYTIIAVVVLLLSLVPNILMAINPDPTQLAGVTTANALALGLMHVPAAFFCVWFLTRR